VQLGILRVEWNRLLIEIPSIASRSRDNISVIVYGKTENFAVHTKASDLRNCERELLRHITNENHLMKRVIAKRRLYHSYLWFCDSSVKLSYLKKVNAHKAPVSQSFNPNILAWKSFRSFVSCLYIGLNLKIWDCVIIHSASVEEEFSLVSARSCIYWVNGHTIPYILVSQIVGLDPPRDWEFFLRESPSF
jgi:hypothetical protein